MVDDPPDEAGRVIKVAEPTLRFAKDNVIGLVAALATLFYGFSEYVNKQQAQEKTFIEQFSSAVEKFVFPAECKDISQKHKAYLMSATFAANKLSDNYDEDVYLQMIQPLANRYIEFEGECAKATEDPGTPDELKDTKQQRTIASNNIKIKEVAQAAPKGANWHVVVASFPEGQIATAEEFACKLKAAKPDLAGRSMQIYTTKLSRSTAVVIDAPKDRTGAANAAQDLRSKSAVPDAFAQVDRDWKLEKDLRCRG